MERKIGEIFEYNGEWYQCVQGDGCNACAFANTDCDAIPVGDCAASRRDRKPVLFKKLEKVGEPYSDENSVVSKRLFQKYRLYERNFIYNERNVLFASSSDFVSIEIKQPEEGMEEKKQDISKMETTTKRMRPFDLEAAKSGKPVCTRDGRKARIVCFDRKSPLYSVIALIEEPDGEEEIVLYSKDGHYEPDGTLCELDLMMLPEKKEGWAMICKSELYESEDIALEDAKRFEDYIKTVKVEWYE